jgi:hypothetical protein
MMNKKIIMILCAIIFIQNGFAQKANAVYGISKSPVRISLHKKRNILGGTVINATYSRSSIHVMEKGAFEYACKLVEECVPTTCPLKVKIDFSDSLPDGVLASVFVKQADGMFGHYGDNTFDKVYAKRYVQMYREDGFSDKEEGLAFYRDSEDAVITFSSKVKFNYSIDTSELKSDEYDFITVAEQSLIKAVGFICKANTTNEELNISYPANQYTIKLLDGKADENYIFATSGNAFLTAYHSDAQWLLESNAPYRPGISLNYLSESNGDDTAIMQYGISPGSYIRNIGKFIKTFFSFCDWDRPIAVGMGGSLMIDGVTSDDVVSFAGVGSEPQKSSVNKVTAVDSMDLDEYLRSVSEVGDDGDYVLLKDGTWCNFNRLYDLKNNDAYARTVDGYLRIKNIRTEPGPDHNYVNWIITYRLYSYLPQKAEAQMLSYTESQEAVSAFSSRRKSPRNTSGDTYIDVNIGMKNLEGTDYVIVEQADEDYPVPYSYVINNPQTGHFIASMNKKYSSTFKLTYVNANGKTVGDPFTIKVKDVPSQVGDVELKLNGTVISYKVNDRGQKIKYHYFITNLDTGVGAKQGDITQMYGNIDVSSLPSGSYAINVYGYEPSMIRVAQMVWFNKK